MPIHRVEEKGVGYGWGCLRFFTAALILLFSFIGFAVFLGSRAVLLPFIFALTLAVLWFLVARNFRWEWGLLIGTFLIVLGSGFLVVIGYLIHPHQIIPGR